MHMSKKVWLEAMAGTVSFYDDKGKRQHTIYLGDMPEYGKTDFFRRFTVEIERVKVLFPRAKRVGLGCRLSKYSNFKCILISRLMDSNRLKNRLELIENRC
jgi:hypothetical protein